MDFCVRRESSDEKTLKEVGQGVIAIHFPARGRVSLVLVMAFLDGLHAGDLPVCRLYVGFPHAIKKYQQQGLKINVSRL